MNEEYIKNIISQFPLFIPEINNALINKNWLLFDEYLEQILDYLEENNEIMLFPWEDLIKSNEIYLPKEIDLNEWQNFGLIILSKQTINFLNGDDLTTILKNLEYQTLENFFNKILEIIPEKNYNEKLTWLEENKPDFYFIFLTLPINPFINNFLKEKYLKINEKELEKHFDNLNFNLISELLSYQNAKNILNFSSENLFTQEKTIKITYLIGEVLLGFIKAGNLENEIIKIFEFEKNEENLELINKIKNYILNNYLIPNQEEISKLYILATDILKNKTENVKKEIEIPINLIKDKSEIEKIKKIDFSSLFKKEENEKNESEEIIEKENKPLIIEQIPKIDIQKSESKNEERKEEKIKTYFSPFKIFNKFTNKIKTEINAKIEKPKEIIINYTENKTNLELENENNLNEEIFLKPKLQEKTNLNQEDENTINLKIN